jgi:DNA-binding transcriptional regulator of glucitol operon
MANDVYVLVAIDEDQRVRECIVVRDMAVAGRLFDALREIWGGRNVCMASRLIDDIPENVAKYAHEHLAANAA